MSLIEHYLKNCIQFENESIIEHIKEYSVGTRTFLNAKQN